MKKSICTLILASLLASFALVSASALEATVLSARGKAEVQKGTSWATLSAGSKLQKGDVIQTGFKSELILKIKETTVTVAPLSRITIEQLAEKSDKDDTRLYLDTGSLKSDVKKTEDRRVGFTVRSPVATASVRGTVFSITNKYQSTDVVGYAGSTAVWKSDKPQSPEVAKDNGEETPAVTGNNANAVSDGAAPRGAVLVKTGQTASCTNSTSVSQKDSAQSKMNDLGGAKTPIGGASDAMGGPNQKGQKTSTVKVVVTVQETATRE